MNNKWVEACVIYGNHQTDNEVSRKKGFLYTGLFLLGCLLFWPTEAEAQRRDRTYRFQNLLEHDHRPYHFGFLLGLNTYSFHAVPVSDFDQYEFTHVLEGQDYGFHLGIVSNLKLNRFMDLRFVPTLVFSERYIEFYTDEFDVGYSERQDLEATVLEFPLHLKFKSERIGNTRAFVFGGMKYTHDLASIELGVGDDILARIARNDVHYELGVGFDHYFFYFKFSTELKASFGMGDLIRPGELGPHYTNSIDRLNSRTIMLSFTFE